MSLIDTLRQAGFKGDGLRQAWAIANRESGGRPDAFNGNTGTGDRSWGIFQINTLGPLQARVKQYGLKSERDLLDPNTNASVAYRMSKGGTDFGAWGVGPNAYRKTPPLDFTGFAGGQQSRRPGGDDPLGPAEPSRPGPWDPLTGSSDPKRQLALSLLASRRGQDRRPDRRSLLLSMLMSQGQQTPQASPPALPPTQPQQPKPQQPGGGGIRELFYDPLGAYDEGNWIKPIGGHSDHVHASFGNPKAALAGIKLAQELGLRASENPYVDKVDPVHTERSFHYRNFPGQYGGRQLGQGLDVSGSPNVMAAYFRRLKQTIGQ